MKPYYEQADATLHAGDCLDVLRQLPDNSVDSIVTDPPAGIAFMGKEWDGAKGGREQWSAWLADVMRECLRVAKPGAHALVWALPRTSHWTACGLEDGGWVIRDRIAHAFGSGFPKSAAVDKAIDRQLGGVRRVVGRSSRCIGPSQERGLTGSSTFRESGWEDGNVVTAPATDAARQWEGWGTALKPAAEDWWLARKPLEGTVGGNVLQWGTGALNVDGCRVRTDDDSPFRAGRWPANLLLSHSADCEDRCAEDCPVALMDRQSGVLTSGKMQPTHTTAARNTFGQNAEGGYTTMETYGDSGGASRFFPQFRPDPFLYTAKAASSERPRGQAPPNGTAIGRKRCGICGKQAVNVRPSSQCQCPEPQWEKAVSSQAVAHPTVKPLDLMRWLVRLITPPGGIVLDPFAGSGTTGEATLLEGMQAVLIEREPDYLPLIVQRLTRQRDPVAHAKATGTEGEGLW